MSRTITASVILIGVATLAGCGIGDAQTRLRSAVDAKSPELNQCYAAALQRNRDVAGTLEANLHVDSTEGRVSQVEFTGGAGRDAELESCMTDTLSQVQLSEPPPAKLKVEYTFQLTPQG